MSDGAVAFPVLGHSEGPESEETGQSIAGVPQQEVPTAPSEGPDSPISDNANTDLPAVGESEKIIGESPEMEQHETESQEVPDERPETIAQVQEDPPIDAGQSTPVQEITETVTEATTTENSVLDQTTKVSANAEGPVVEEAPEISTIEESKEVPVAEGSTGVSITEEPAEVPAMEELAETPAVEVVTRKSVSEETDEVPVVEEATEKPAVEETNESPVVSPTTTEEAAEVPVVEEVTEVPAFEAGSESPVVGEVPEVSTTEGATETPAVEEGGESPAPEETVGVSTCEEAAVVEEATEPPAAEEKSESLVTEAVPEVGSMEGVSEVSAAEEASEVPVAEGEVTPMSNADQEDPVVEETTPLPDGSTPSTEPQPEKQNPCEQKTKPSFDENAVFRERTLLSQRQEISSDDPLLQLLDDPTKGVADFIECSSIVPIFKANNQKLIDRLTSDSGMRDLMELFVKSNDRKTISRIAELFLATNSRLLQSLSMSVNMLEPFSQLIYDREHADYFKFGFLTQILTTATVKWPERMYKLFYQSPTFWPSVLRSLDIDCVANCVCQLMESNDPQNHGFLWGYLSAALPDLMPLVHPPKNWNVKADGVITSETIRVGREHRVKLIKMFRLFLLSFPDEQEFAETIATLIRTVLQNATKTSEKIDLGALLDVALVIPREDVVADAAMKVLLERPLEFSPLFEKALEYLTINYDDRQFDHYLHLIFAVLRHDRSNSFINLRLRDLIDTIMEQSERCVQLIQALQHMIVYCWNRRPSSGSSAKTALLLALGDLVGNVQGFSGWEIFLARVLRPYRKKDVIPRDFKVPELGMDRDLINSLVPPPVTKPIASARVCRSTRTLKFSRAHSSIGSVTFVHRRRHSTGDPLLRTLYAEKTRHVMFNCEIKGKKRGRISKRASLDPRLRSHTKNTKESKGRKSVGARKRNCTVS